jgi:hypothetical protein
MANLSLNLTKVTGTGSVGTVASQKFLSGNTATGSVGTITSANRSITLSGVSATCSVGTVTSGRTETGVTATGSVGTISVVNPTLNLGLNGVTNGTVTFKYPTFADAAFGALVPNSVTGGSTVGSVANVNKSFALSSVSVTGSVGNISATIGLATNITGTSATGSVGNVIAGVPLTISITGVITQHQEPVYNWATFGGSSFASLVPNGTQTVSCNVGNLIASRPITLNLSGVSSTGSVGSVSSFVDESLSLTGNTATSSVSSLSIGQDFNLSSTTATGFVNDSSAAQVLSGVSNAGSVGNVGFQSDYLRTLIGVAAFGSVNTILIKPHFEIITDVGAADWVPADVNIGDGWSIINNNLTTWDVVNTDSGIWNTVSDAEPVDWQLVTTEG